MTIKIAASRKALTDSAPIDLDDPSQLPDFYTTATLGFDLSALGAQRMEVPGEYGSEPAVKQLNFPLLMASVNAAFHGKIDYIQLNRDFHKREDTLAHNSHRPSLPDAVQMAHEIAQKIHEGGINVELPFDTQNGLPAVEGFLHSYSGKKSVSLSISAPEDFALLEEFSQRAAKNNLKVLVLSNDLEFIDDHAEKIVTLADAVQLRSEDVTQIRALRFKLHEAARKINRQIKLILEVGIVISATLQSANERATLLSTLTQQQLFSGMTHAVGTVYDVADQIERLVGIGAVDGILFVPASLPTDLASVLKGVVPLMSERSKIEIA